MEALFKRVSMSEHLDNNFVTAFKMSPKTTTKQAHLHLMVRVPSPSMSGKTREEVTMAGLSPSALAIQRKKGALKDAWPTSIRRNLDRFDVDSTSKCQSNELRVTSLVEESGAVLLTLTGSGWSLAAGSGGWCGGPGCGGPGGTPGSPSSELTLPSLPRLIESSLSDWNRRNLALVSF